MFICELYSYQSADDLFLENCIAEENARKQTGNSEVLKKLAQEQIDKQKSQQTLIDSLVRLISIQ